MKKIQMLLLLPLFLIILIPSVFADCNAFSRGYWMNNEGCSYLYGGSSLRVSEIWNLSNNYQGYFGFSEITGPEVCDSLRFFNQDPRHNAEANTLTLYSNIVSGKLQLDALIAGSVNQETESFTRLCLNSGFTINETVIILENVLSNASATDQDLWDVSNVAERITEFYIHENPIDPQCIYGCFSDDDCSYIDNNHCDGDIIKHDEGYCEDYICYSNTTIVENCDDNDKTYC